MTPFQTLWRGGSGWGRLPVGSSRRLGGRGFVKHVGTILQQRKVNGSENQNLLEQFVSRFRFLKVDSDVLMARREAGLPLHLTQRLGGLNLSPRVPGWLPCRPWGSTSPREAHAAVPSLSVHTSPSWDAGPAVTLQGRWGTILGAIFASNTFSDFPQFSFSFQSCFRSAT